MMLNEGELLVEDELRSVTVGTEFDTLKLGAHTILVLCVNTTCNDFRFVMIRVVNVRRQTYVDRF